LKAKGLLGDFAHETEAEFALEYDVDFVEVVFGDVQIALIFG